jgi:preprotein translocase subunit SecG
MTSRLEFHKAIQLKRITVIKVSIFLATALFLAFNHWSIAQEKTCH